jgi:hypothetical protein
MWQDYISFLSGAKQGTPTYTALWTAGMVGGQEEAARTNELRCVRATRAGPPRRRRRRPRLCPWAAAGSSTHAPADGIRRPPPLPSPHRPATDPPAPRKQYQQAIVVPTHSTELLWKQYEAFEMSQVRPGAGGRQEIGGGRRRVAGGGGGGGKAGGVEKRAGPGGQVGARRRQPTRRGEG